MRWIPPLRQSSHHWDHVIWRRTQWFAPAWRNPQPWIMANPPAPDVQTWVPVWNDTIRDLQVRVLVTKTGLGTPRPWLRTPWQHARVKR